MRDRSIIYIGLFIFLAVVTLPFTLNLTAGGTADPPDLVLPENETQCVESADFMRSSHMQLLLDWREEYVRRNVREYTATNGKSFNIGLTDTCLAQCHTNKADFCDRCHAFAGVQGPYCMDCHIDPTEALGGQQ